MSEVRDKRPRVSVCKDAGTAERSYPMSEVRGSGQEEQPHARGQGQWPGAATPRPRSGGCVGTGGLKGATPCSRSGGAAERRYTSSNEKGSGCTLLEQP